MAKAKVINHDFEKDGYRTLFLEWLLEWKLEAANMQSRIQYTYANAMKSLKNYPLPIYSGHGCIKLNYFGDHTCKKLEKKLTSYLKEKKLQRITGPDPFLLATASSNDIDITAAGKKPAKKNSPKKKSNCDLSEADHVDPTAAAKKPAKKRALAKRKSSEDDLAIMEEEDAVPPLPNIRLPDLKNPKSRSVEELSSYASTSSGFDCVDPLSSQPSLPSASRSTSTLSVQSDLIKRTSGLVFTRGVTTTLIGGGGGLTARTNSASDLEKDGPHSNQSADLRFTKVPFEEFTLRPGSFDVVLCVDNQEIHGRGHTRSKLDIVAELKKQDLNFSVRSLKAGDFLWIAQEKADFVARDKRKSARELVLDFIAERKRGDDLATSIKDGRYTCQKFRMKTASLRRIIYIVEDAQRFSNKGLSDQAFHQALVNMEVQDGFLVKETENLQKTAEYLLMMTKYLQRIYSSKSLKSCPYAQRCEQSSAQFNINLPSHNLLSFAAFSVIAKTNQSKSVSQTFLLHLLALDGVSPAKASAIVAKYPTVRRLMQAYDECVTQPEKELLLRDIKFGSGLTKIGPVISKKICQLYCTTGPLI